jgi:hypothetical protein
MNELAKKWNNTGLLDQLADDTQREECAEILEKTAQILVSVYDPNPTEKDGYKKWQDFCGFALPMARRLYDCLYPSRIKFPDVDWFIEDAREFFNNNHELYNELANDHWTAGIDAGAEMCAMYELRIMEKMNKQ